MADGKKRDRAAPVAVVTGASSGIGRATAEHFAERGYSVVVIARRKDLLEKLIGELRARHPHGEFLAVKCDICSWEQVSAARDEVRSRFPGVHVLVNNAGAYEYQSLEKSSPEKLDELINVNVRGVIYVTKAFLPLLKSAVTPAREPKIVNVSSIGGLWGFPNMAVYTATKFAVTGFTSALRRELRQEGIGVASIHPGPVQSPDVAAAEPGKKKALVMTPAKIAEQIFGLATSRKARFISHPAFSLLNVVEYFSPEMVDRILKKIL